MEISDCFAGGGAGAVGRGWRRLWESGGTTKPSAPNPMGHHEYPRVNVFTIRSPASRGAGVGKMGVSGRGDSPVLESQKLPLGPPSRQRRQGTLAQTCTPTPRAAVPVCSATAGAPSPRGALHTQRPEPRARHLIPQDPTKCVLGTPPSRPAPHLQRRSITGRSDRGFSGGAEGSGGGGQNQLRARGADAAPAAAASAREPPASPAARPHRICTPGRGRAGGGASLNRLRPDPGQA